MKSAPSSSTVDATKCTVAALVLLILMGVAFYFHYSIQPSISSMTGDAVRSEEPASSAEVASSEESASSEETASVEPPAVKEVSYQKDLHEALDEQRVLIEEIHSDVDDINRHLDEINQHLSAGSVAQ